METERLSFPEILLRETSLTDEQLNEALEIQKEKSGKLKEILFKLNYLKEEDFLKALSKWLGILYLSELSPLEIDRELISKIPINFAKKYEVIPLNRDGDEVRVATSDPMNTFLLDDLRLLLKCRVQAAAAPSRQILATINQVYDRARDSAEQMMDDLNGGNLDSVAEGLEEPEDLLDVTDEAPIIKLVNSLLFRAVKERASDIHIEPFEKDLSVRIRIDGVLHEVIRPPKRIQSSITSRVKIMGGLNIAEKRLPQDGRIRLKIAGKDIDIRLSTVPTSFGERVVMRLLDRSSILLGLDEIGLLGEKLMKIERLIRRSNGILLVTGPTGSGKTTTLYAALSRINSPDKNIITIEDPVEYQLKGIGQIHVNPKIDLTFANGLRSILRQDPDVIMVGEIRDTETAGIAIHASLTGHLVLSTLHTNDAPGAVTRLIDMGIEPFLVSSSVVAIIAQRLVRLICPDCREEVRPTEAELSELSLKKKELDGKAIFRGKGCSNCMGTGYKGRTGIYELLLVDDKIRTLILNNADSNTIKREGVKRGMYTLRMDGSQKVVDGITTIEEVLRVTQEEIGD
ncbi:MAG: type II secretion system ATPase GspE [Deltaproteobacteria bacterium]|nr:MAG: type II secretion system ATPase GspE [Deltaproteobacteria bacterium]